MKQVDHLKSELTTARQSGESQTFAKPKKEISQDERTINHKLGFELSHSLDNVSEALLLLNQAQELEKGLTPER